MPGKFNPRVWAIFSVDGCWGKNRVSDNVCRGSRGVRGRFVQAGTFPDGDSSGKALLHAVTQLAVSRFINEAVHKANKAAVDTRVLVQVLLGSSSIVDDCF